GLPLAVGFAEAGQSVIGVDIDDAKVAAVQAGHSYIEDVSSERLRGVLDRVEADTRFSALARADAVLICVPAILDAQRRPSLEALRRACAAVVRNAHAGQTLVLTSASRVGSTRELLVEPLRERGLRVGVDVFVAFSPTRMDLGVPEHEQLRTPRVVGAVSETCFGHASELLGALCDGVHRVSSPEAAEMAKLYESTFRAVNIALACEIADACQAHGLDPLEITAAAASKPFGFLAHAPSAGVGGHGVPVDPHHLLAALRERGRPATLAEEAMRALDARPGRIAMRAHELLVQSGRSLREARVLVVGAAYKPGVADCCGAPAAQIVSWLAAEGVQVAYHDPLVPVLSVEGEDMHSVDPDPRRDASGFGPEDYDLAIVVTVHPGHDYGWLRRCPEVLDCTYEMQAGRRRVLP
ncbi:MAG TPA: nucleotide sugar dehydrogenase, partial [Solirubrobacteraceae bacterium]|nr:nucleotide sugar dehydrogenase [Solirubrobacteraceae bacterium]